MFKLIRKPLRPFYRSAAVAVLWANRRDALRWAKFAKRAASGGTRPTAADLKLEARVRLSLSLDPVLRQDASLQDVRVRNGVVTLQSPDGWHNRGIAVKRLGQINGVESVQTATDLDTVDATQSVTPSNYLSAARAAS